ncbi:MAG: DUF3095 family protein [Pseudomonadota bacterium]
MQASSTKEFVNLLPIQEQFSDALPRSNYKEVPDSWYVAVTDVVQSRQAISQGKYKSVNMAGVSMISAIMNAIGHQEVPYIFGGDGAAVVFAPDDLGAVQNELSAVVGWSEDELGLTLRAAIVPVSEIYDAGLEMLVTAIRVSSAIRNFGFLGGGIAYAEKIMKEGRFGVKRASAGTMPNLAGLSCRWKPVEEHGNKIVSLIVEPADDRKAVPASVAMEVLDIVHADDPEASKPISEERVKVTWPPQGVGLESRATGESKFKVLMITVLAWVLNLTGRPMGNYDPVRYRKFLALNTDYRKIQDGLRMTLSLSPKVISKLRDYLDQQRDAGSVKYGICEQDGALLTCYVPSFTSDDHFHFLDGAGGGYAAAADDLK